MKYQFHSRETRPKSLADTLTDPHMLPLKGQMLNARHSGSHLPSSYHPTWQMCPGLAAKNSDSVPSAYVRVASLSKLVGLEHLCSAVISSTHLWVIFAPHWPPCLVFSSVLWPC